MYTTNLRKVGGSVILASRPPCSTSCICRRERSNEEREWLHAKPTGGELI